MDLDNLDNYDFLQHLAKKGSSFLLDYINNAAINDTYEKRVKQLKVNNTKDIVYIHNDEDLEGFTERVGKEFESDVFFQKLNKKKLIKVLDPSMFFNKFRYYIKLEMVYNIYQDVFSVGDYMFELEQNDFIEMTKEIIINDYDVSINRWSEVEEFHDYLKHYYDLNVHNKYSIYMDFKYDQLLIEKPEDMDDIIRVDKIERERLYDLKDMLDKHFEDIEKGVTSRLTKLLEAAGLNPRYIIGKEIVSGLVFFYEKGDDRSIYDIGSIWGCPTFYFIKDDEFQSEEELYNWLIGGELYIID